MPERGSVADVRRRPLFASLLIAGSVAVGACGSDAGAPASAPAAGAATGVAPEALRFTAPLVGGGTIDLAAYADQPVLFWFWAPY